MHVDMCGPGAHPISTPKVIHKDFPKQKLDMVVGRGRFSTQGQKWFLEVDDVNELGTCMSLCVNVCVRMNYFLRHHELPVRLLCVCVCVCAVPVSAALWHGLNDV